MSKQFRLGSRIIRVSEPGQLSDSVNVWGDVGSPGRYLIPINTTLPELISYAFGPKIGTNSATQLNWSKRRIEVFISGFNAQNGKKTVTHFEYHLNQPLPEGMRTFNLKNNQVVSVRVRRTPTFKDYISIIAPTISAIATAVLLYFSIKNN